MITNASLQVPICPVQSNNPSRLPQSPALFSTAEVCCCKPQGFLLPYLDNHSRLPVQHPLDTRCIILDPKRDCNFDCSGDNNLIFMCINFDYLFLYQNFKLSSINDVLQKITSLLSSLSIALGVSLSWMIWLQV